ncbi:hypothetical protein Taro_047986 [Colocasia esculenta]|uniref:Uncharacterized protein n=1 Tax=Colocasia esculenta TaxID=4460 RepID=A0A843WXC3_COLES|nr:hypothetical protein [Colocasia esculenta]
MEYGYLAVPTHFESIPPVVEFPNFLGVTFVDILHLGAGTGAGTEAEAEHEAEVKKTTKKLSYHVHHVENGNHNKSKGKGTNKYFQQAREDDNIVTRRARVSNSGKSVRVGDLRIHLQAKRVEAVPERVTPSVPVKNSFNALSEKREMFNTFKGKLPPKPIKFKKVWRPKRVQTPRQEEPVPKETKPRETIDVKVSSYQRPPRGFKAKVQQGGACAYARFHNKRAELRRSAYVPIVWGNPLTPVVVAMCHHQEKTRSPCDHILGLATSPLQ